MNNLNANNSAERTTFETDPASSTFLLSQTNHIDTEDQLPSRSERKMDRIDTTIKRKKILDTELLIQIS